MDPNGYLLFQCKSICTYINFDNGPLRPLCKKVNSYLIGCLSRLITTPAWAQDAMYGKVGWEGDLNFYEGVRIVYCELSFPRR